MTTVKEDFVSISGDIFFKGEPLTDWQIYSLSFHELKTYTYER